MVYKTHHFQTAPKPWGFFCIYLFVYLLSELPNKKHLMCFFNGEYTSAQREKHYHSPPAPSAHTFLLSWVGSEEAEVLHHAENHHGNVHTPLDLELQPNTSPGLWMLCFHGFPIISPLHPEFKACICCPARTDMTEAVLWLLWAYVHPSFNSSKSHSQSYFLNGGDQSSCTWVDGLSSKSVFIDRSGVIWFLVHGWCRKTSSLISGEFTGRQCYCLCNQKVLCTHNSIRIQLISWNWFSLPLV